MRDEGLRLPIHYVRHIRDQVRSLGGDVGRWLGECGLSEAALEGPSIGLGYDGFERLVVGAIAATGEPALGLFVGQRLVATAHGMLGYAAMSAGTIREALAVLERYSGVRTSLLAISTSTARGAVRVRFAEARPLGAARRAVLEAVVLSIRNVLAVVSLGACPVTEVAFPFEAPAYAPLARELFGCEVRYGRAWAGLVLPADAVDARLTMADPEAFAEAARICQRELDKLVADESTSARVRRALFDKQAEFPSLALVARRLHTTPRTLHRRLVEEGTSYRALLEEVRHALALEQVRSGRASMQEIAFSLGYSDLANFRRAFKRWEAAPSSQVRAAARAPAGPARRGEA